MSAWRARSYQLITSGALLHELSIVLSRASIRRRTGYSESDNGDFVAAIADGVIVSPTERIDVLRDTADNRLLEAAIAGAADYIVSGDREVLALGSSREVRIITPAQFLAVLSGETD